MTRRSGSRPSFDERTVVLDDDPRLLRHTVQVLADFGHPDGGEQTFLVVNVPADWVSADSVITCMPAGLATADHGVYDAALEQLSAYAANREPGVGFDVVVTAPSGTWGRHLITVTG